MNKILMVAAPLLLALTACGGGDPAPTPPPSIALTDKAVTVVNGDPETSVNMMITRANGHSEEINLAVTGAPAGLTATFTKTTLSSAEALAVLKVKAVNVATGNYTLNLTASSPSSTATAKVTITVKSAIPLPAPDPQPAPAPVPNTSQVRTTYYSSLKELDVFWNSVSGATGYRVDRKCGTDAYVELTTAPISQTYYFDKSPVIGTACIYRVRTVKGTEVSSGTESAPVTVPTAPLPETAYVSAAANSTSIYVTWSSVVGATEYKLDRKTSTSSFSEIASLTGATTSYSDTAVIVGQTYTYRVRVVTSGGTSAGNESYPVRFSGSSGPGPSPCCKICTTGKPCGDTCIAANKTCNTPGGCACSGGSMPSIVFQRIEDCNKVPAIGLNALGQEIYLGTYGDWAKQTGLIPLHK